MITVRKADSIYYKDGGWFQSRWHFSFDEFYDSSWMGFGVMRVFNDDWLVPGAVWPMHPHRDVEGLTYVPQGVFKHEDSLGNDGVLPAGSVQRMTLGSGAYHSEQNGSQTEPIRFIQIWILPREKGLPPGVEQKIFTKEQRMNRLLHVIGPNRDDGAVLVHQDASMYVSTLEAGNSVEHAFQPGYGGYLYVIEGGPVTVNHTELQTGDAALIEDEERIAVQAGAEAHLILMDVRLGDPAG